MADQTGQAGGQGSANAPAATISAVTLLIQVGQGVSLPRSRSVLLVDSSAPQSLDLTIPNLHYGSRSPIRGILECEQPIDRSTESSVESEILTALIPSVGPIAEGGIESSAVGLD